MTSRKYVPYIYILPSFLVMFIFVILPVVATIIMSFYSVPSINAQWVFIGLKNYATVFHGGDFGLAVFNTLLFGGSSLIINFVFGIILSLLLAKHKRLRLFIYLFYIPGVVSSITMGQLYNRMFSPSQNGFLNIIIDRLFHLEPVNWFGDNPWVARWSIILIGLIGAGGGMTLILFTTAINDIDPTYYEVAMMEGASNFKICMSIIVPLIRPVLTSWILINLIGALKSFEFIYAMTRGGPARSTSTIAILLFENAGSSAGYGSTAAMGVVMTAMITVITLIYAKIAKINKVED